MPDTVTYHVACHLQAQNAGLRSRDLLKAGRRQSASLVQRCSGIDGTWGYRAENYELGRKTPTTRPRDRGGRQRHRLRRLPFGQRFDPAGNRHPTHPSHAVDGPGLRPGRPRGRRGSGERAVEGGLTLADVLDLRTTERVREDYRARDHRPQAATGGWRWDR